MIRSGDQEQIFESDEQAESLVLPVNHAAQFQPQSEDVITNSLNTLSSFDFFHTASLSSHNKSSNNGQPRRNRGHNPLESPYERYLRLKMELNELSDELQEMQDIQSKDKQSIWALLQEETKKLSLESENLLAKFPNQLQQASSANNEQERLHSEILSDIQNKLQAIPSSSSSSMIGSSSSSALSSIVNEKALMGLEQRVYRLETMLGIHSNYLDLQIANQDGLGPNSVTTAFPLVHIVQRLEQKVALLDSTTLDALRTKFIAFKNEVVASTSASGSGGSNDTVMKVLDAVKKLDHLIDSVTKIDAVVDELPIILTRLKTLEGIHWNASMFTNRLQSMEKEIQSMTQEVASNQEVLEEIKIGLRENLAIMQENVQKVENRLARADL